MRQHLAANLVHCIASMLLDPPAADAISANLSRERMLASTQAYCEKLFGGIVTLFHHEGETLTLKLTPFV